MFYLSFSLLFLTLQEIAQKNIDANMELAMEASPESFGSVIMLYINCKWVIMIVIFLFWF